jgi:carboxymethylenebutenolidase
MKNSPTFALAVFFLSTWAVASFAATSKEVSYQSGDERVHAIVYTPDGEGTGSKARRPGLRHARHRPYRGKVATTPELAHEISRGVPEDRAQRDLHAAYEFLRTQPKVRKDRMAAIGWCMGGGYALDVALQEPSLTADVINYGHLVNDGESL